MKKPKIFLRSALYAVMIGQMVFAPLAPVLADELNSSAGESLNTAISITAPTIDPIINQISVPVQEPVGNVQLIATQPESQVVPVNSFTISSGSSTFVNNVAIPVTENAQGFVVTTSITLVTQPTTTIISVQTENTTSSIFEIASSSLEASPAVPLENEEESKEKKDKKDGQEIANEYNIQASVVQVSDEHVKKLNKAKKVEEDGNSYEVVDKFVDVAYGGNGKKTYRIYSQPRQIYETSDGLKVHEKGWNLFDEIADTQTQDLKKTGYGFKVRFGKDNDIELSRTSLQIDDIAYDSKIPVFKKREKDKMMITDYKDVFDNIDVRLTDNYESRSKEIIINQPPKDLKKGSTLVFWEEYVLPVGAKVINKEGISLEGQSEQIGSYLYVQTPDGSRLFITGPGVYDGKANDPVLRDLKSLVKVIPQIVIIDRDSGSLKIGIKLESNYLLDEQRVYPVTIDPVYYACSETFRGGVDGGCNGFTELYLRYKIGNSLIDAGADSTKLYSGSATDGGLPVTRHAVLKFGTSFIPANEDVTVARLYLYNGNYSGLGSDTNTDLVAKKITTSWVNATGLTYTAIRAGLQRIGISSQNVSKVGQSTWKDWDITNAVQSWKSSPASNYGMVVEPEPAWNFANALPTGWKRAVVMFDSRTNNSSNGPYIAVNTVVQSQPDLTRESYSLPKVIYQQGETINFGVRIKNVGSSSMGRTTKLRYFFNRDNIYYDRNQILEDTIPNLAAGAFVDLSISFTVPANTTPGQYFLSYFMDGYNDVIEGSDQNNQFAHFISINGQTADLTYSNDSISSSNILPGGSVTLNTTIRNNGGDTGYTGNVYYYFKKDSVSYGSSDKVGEDTFPALGMNGISAEDFTYTIPANISPGTYYLSYWIDPLLQISESNDNNNQKSFQITVMGTQDLQATDFSITNPSSRLTGDTVDIHGMIRNYGTLLVNSVAYTLGIIKTDTGQYYSLTNLSGNIGFISAGSAVWVDLRGTIPDALPYSGLYQVVITLDPSNTISEFDESNNSAQTATAIQVQRRNIGGGESYDVDNDGQTDVAEVAGGTSITGKQQTMELYDKIKLSLVKSILTDGKYVVAGMKNDAGQNLSAVKNTTVGNTEGGDPVNLRTGALELEQTDINLPSGAGFPIKFMRTYNSKLYDWNARLGNGWSHSYELYYYQSTSTHDVQVYLGGSLATIFSCATNDCTPSGGGTFAPMKGTLEKLIKENGYLVYQTVDGVKYIFSKKVDDQMFLAEKIVDTNNNNLTLGYTNARGVPLLTSVSSSPSRYVYFTYPIDPTTSTWDKIQEVRSNIGGVDALVARYTYDAEKRLVGVRQQNYFEGDPVKNIDHVYTYDAVSSTLLTYKDPRGTELQNIYDNQGRVTVQFEKSVPRGDVVARKIYEFNYREADLNAPGSTHCTDLITYRSASTTYNESMCFNSDELKIYAQKGSVVERWQYNADGMPTSYTDGEANVISYTYDADRRMTRETLPDINNKRTVVTYEYWNNPSRLKTKTETVTSGGNTLNARSTSFTVPQDGKGNITQVLYPAEASEGFTYNTNGTVNTHTNKLGAIVSYGYDINAFKTSESATVLRADGANQSISKQFVNDSFGRVTTFTDANNNTFSYSYDFRGNLRRETNPGLDVKSYEYDLEDHKVKDIDELGRVTTYNYDTDINASLLNITKESSDGNIVNRREYDYVGNLLKEIDSLGREISLAYDSSNRVATKTDPKKTSTYEYFNNNLLKKEMNTAGQRVDYFYDARENKIEVRKFYDDVNYVTNRWVYDGLNRVTSEFDGKNQETVFSYDDANRPTSKMDAKNGVWEYFYDSAGNKTGERSARAHDDGGLRNSNSYTNSYIYDGLGRLIKVRNSADKVTLNYYDGNGNLTRVVDRQNSDGTLNTHENNTEYYSNNLKKKEIFVDGGQIEYAYDKVGNLKSRKDQMNRTWTYNYDDFNRLIDEIDPQSKTTSNAYDAAGNKTVITYPDNTKSKFYYNELNLLTAVVDANNNTSTFAYDAVGNKTSETDKRQNTAAYVYDKLNRLMSETNTDLTVTSYAYDANSNRLSSSVAGKSTGYEFDELNRPTKITYPGNKSESFTYDKNGNKATYTNGNSQTTSYDYDKLDRLTAKHLTGDFSLVTYAYDNWSNLTNLNDESGTTAYQYDVENRLLNETKNIAGLAGEKSAGRTYNTAGQLASLTDAAGRTANYAYDNRGLLQTVGVGQVTLATYTYNAFGKPATLTYGNGLVTSYGYDALNRTASIETKNSSSTIIFKQEYEYDAESNRTKMIETRIGEDGAIVSSTVNYTYDNLEQLTDVDYANINGVENELAYRYDQFGNRTQLNDLSGSAVYNYTVGTNELSSVSYNDGKLSIASQYDSNGSLTKEIYSRLGVDAQEVNYAWDAQNRLAGITYHTNNQPTFAQSADNYLQFVYDDFGNRVKKSSSRGDTMYYFNDGLTVLNEIKSDGTVGKTIVRGFDQIAEIDQDGKISYIHQDVLGSAVMISNEQGTVTMQYEYNPFGQIITEVGDSSTGTNYLFTNQEFDPESELYYYNARYYNPVLGRFISRDAMLGRDGDVLSRNLYIYVKNNPLKYKDSTGNTPELILQKLNDSSNEWINRILGVETAYAANGNDLMCKINEGDNSDSILTGLGVGFSVPGNISVKIPSSNYIWSMNPPPSYLGKSTSVIQLYDAVNSSKGIRLDYGYNVVTKDVNWHWNQKGTFANFGIADHSLAGGTMSAVGNASKVVKGVGRVALPVAVASDAYSIYESDNRPREVTRVAGGWAGAYAMGQAGAMAGAAGGATIGSAIPVVGTAAGAAAGGLVGGIGGGVAGYFGGSAVAQKIYDYIDNF